MVGFCARGEHATTRMACGPVGTSVPFPWTPMKRFLTNCVWGFQRQIGSTFELGPRARAPARRGVGRTTTTNHESSLLATTPLSTHSSLETNAGFLTLPLGNDNAHTVHGAWRGWWGRAPLGWRGHSGWPRPSGGRQRAVAPETHVVDLVDVHSFTFAYVTAFVIFMSSGMKDPEHAMGEPTSLAI